MKIRTGSGAPIWIKLAVLWAEHTVALLPGNYYVDLGYEWQHKKMMSVILKKQWKVVARHHSSSSVEHPSTSIPWESMAAELCKGGFSLKTQVTQKFWVMLSVNTSVPAPGTATSRHVDVKRESCMLKRCWWETRTRHVCFCLSDQFSFNLPVDAMTWPSRDVIDRWALVILRLRLSIFRITACEFHFWWLKKEQLHNYGEFSEAPRKSFNVCISYKRSTAIRINKYPVSFVFALA